MTQRRLRLTAYVLAADPSWIEESVASYYDHVDRIVVSYDRTSTSWTGTRTPVEECLRRLKEVDPAGKLVDLPGSYYVPGREPFDSETLQRNEALAAASEDADWVVQLDADEVLGDADAFTRAIEEADQLGFDGVDYPARLIYQHVRGPFYLEQSRRLWGVGAHYPGPMAVRAGTHLTHARQIAGDVFRVDFKKKSTSPWHPADAPVHHVIKQSQALFHYTMVRSDAIMDVKAESNSHAHDFDWAPVIDKWRWSREHPVLAVLGTPARRGPNRKLLRPAWVPDAPDLAARRRNGLPR